MAYQYRHVLDGIGVPRVPILLVIASNQKKSGGNGVINFKRMVLWYIIFYKSVTIVKKPSNHFYMNVFKHNPFHIELTFAKSIQLKSIFVTAKPNKH